MDEKDTIDTDPTNQDDAQGDQSADDEQSDITPSGQPDEDKEEKLYAGKFKSDEELEKAYKELESKLGGRAEVEEKAKAFDRLVRQKQTPAPVSRPRLSEFVTDDGSIDVKAYDEATEKYETQKDQYTKHTSSKSAQEASDAIRGERDYPFIATDQKAQKLARGLYLSGEVDSLYEAIKEVAEMRNETSTTAKQTGAKEKEREIAKKIRGRTEGAGSKDTSGVITPEIFAGMTREGKRAYINKITAEAEE